MAYTASALAFLLRGLGKPVVVTGSQIPLGVLRSDGRQNLLTSVLVAARDDVREVVLVFGSQILAGARAVKASASGFEAFTRPNAAPLGAAGVLINDRRVAPARAGARGAVALPLALDADVALLRLYPGMPAALLRAAMAEPIKGLVIEAYGAGTFADADPYLFAALADGARRDIVIVVVSQCADGRVDLGAYATSGPLIRAGAVGGLDMTTEAAYAKLVVLLSEGHPPDDGPRAARAGPRGRAHAVSEVVEVELAAREGEVAGLVARPLGLRAGPSRARGRCRRGRSRRPPRACRGRRAGAAASRRPAGAARHRRDRRGTGRGSRRGAARSRRRAAAGRPPTSTC